MDKITDRELTVLGGVFSKSQLEDFMSSLPKNLIWVISEYTDRCTFTKNDLPQLNHLERVRFFGEGGDLEIRRDAEEYRWRFIGPPGVSIDCGFPAADFWTEGEIPFLREHEEKLYLWQKKDSTKDNYRQGKIDSAKLNYPIETKLPNVVINAKVYTSYGRQQFSWYTGLEGAE